MKIKQNSCSQQFQLVFLIVLASTTSSCQDDESVKDELIVNETIDLTHLPFEGVRPTNILIRSQDNPQPDFLSLWQCGLQI
ncbi:hypothetical protein [Psychroserpens sp.]|jgi:hypothetical protein|uniref:hypothetical protein n=1 Tax=Psychroserpens sp. TaxID=2020870 RepID=UPI0039E52951